MLELLSLVSSDNLFASSSICMIHILHEYWKEISVYLSKSVLNLAMSVPISLQYLIIFLIIWMSSFFIQKYPFLHNYYIQNGWLSQKSLDLRAYKQDFKLNLLPIYYFWGKEPWYAARNPASPATSTQHWERINENWIRRKRGVSLSLTGRTGTPLFLCPHVTQ